MNLILQDGLSHIGKFVDCVRAVVKYARQSPERLNKFKEYAEIEMSKHKRAFSRYDNEDRHYRDDLEKTSVPVSSDWANARRLAKFLEHFYELTLKAYVILNSFLDDITSINAALNNCINGVHGKNLVLMAKMMKCKVDKYYGSLEKCYMETLLLVCLIREISLSMWKSYRGMFMGKLKGNLCVP
ncbi:zinc finger BED domain-containing protein RICESLEEPER 2 [Artemisia annua]|uniref:Zinc finger BED domain-containing protein RICESLEEPER 2 n=1 Tax=Artemisia annua TaxID=35608 RepID=A0A2U1KJF1_ARTAN|nr:zinc finger BED domain-containing protein RICESLEEPER 2 [Artemisia annua]